MTARFVRLMGTALTLAAATPVFAQHAKPTILKVTPYAGYMKFGDYATGPIGTRITNAPAAVYGAELSLDLARNFAVVGNVGYSDSNIQVGLPIIGGLNVADTKVLLYDGALQLRLPLESSSRVGITPFVQGGVGAVRYEVRAGPLKTQATNIAFNGGAGIDLQLARNIGMRLLAKDYITKFDFKEATSFNIEGKQTHNLAFSLGLNLGF